MLEVAVGATLRCKITTPRTLKAWLEENEIPYRTDKEIRDEHVIRLYDEDPTRSSREIERLGKGLGIEVNYRTVQRILSRHKSEIENKVS